jgi:pyruvate dehydrogenase E1 component alpha subunit
MVTNNQFGMGTALERHSAVTDLQRKGESFGVPGMRCDGMDVVDTYEVIAEALRRAREERQPVLVEAVTYRFRGHSMADPEEYRTKEQVAEWRKRDPIVLFGERLVADGVMTDEELEAADATAIARVDQAVAFADASPFPPPDALYDDVYVLSEQVAGWYSVDERSPQPHRGEDERAMGPDAVPGAEAYQRHAAGAVDGQGPGPSDEAQGVDAG